MSDGKSAVQVALGAYREVVFQQRQQARDVAEEIDFHVSQLAPDEAALALLGRPTCAWCSNEATCFGSSEGQTHFGCDAHCGHGGEDGWCMQLEELRETKR